MLAAQADYLRAIASGAKTGTEAKFASTLQAAHDKTVSGLKDDPLTFAIKQRVVPDPGPFNPMDPASLKARSLTAGLVAQRYGVPVSPLSDDEATALKNQLNSLSADGKVGMLRQLSAGFEPQNLRMIASQVAKKEDGVLQTAIGLSTEAPEAASRILKSQEILKANPKFGHESAGAVTPGMKSITEEINRLLGDTYKHNAEQQAATRDAILADYAWRSNYMGDVTGSFQAERVKLAVRDVTGGLVTYKSRQVEAPRYGMTDADFSDMVRAADFSPVKGFGKQDILRYGQLETVGKGKYLVKVGDAYLQGKAGPFVVQLPQPSAGAAIGGAGPR